MHKTGVSVGNTAIALFTSIKALTIAIAYMRLQKDKRNNEVLFLLIACNNYQPQSGSIHHVADSTGLKIKAKAEL